MITFQTQGGIHVGITQSSERCGGGVAVVAC
jgi:hypothetical protein